MTDDDYETCLLLLCNKDQKLEGISKVTSTRERRKWRGDIAPLMLNHLTPNGHYMGRTAQLTSRCCILYIYSTNIHTEYFKHAA